MTSLERVPREAVVVADLHVGVADGSRGLPLPTLAEARQWHDDQGSAGVEPPLPDRCWLSRDPFENPVLGLGTPACRASPVRLGSCAGSIGLTLGDHLAAPGIAIAGLGIRLLRP